MFRRPRVPHQRSSASSPIERGADGRCGCTSSTMRRDERREVVARPRTQRRNVQRHDAHAVIQILAEPPFVHLGHEIPVRRRDDADVRRDLPRVSHAPKRPGVEEAEQSPLQNTRRARRSRRGTVFRRLRPRAVPHSAPRHSRSSRRPDRIARPRARDQDWRRSSPPRTARPSGDCGRESAPRHVLSPSQPRRAAAPGSHHSPRAHPPEPRSRA